MLHSFVFLAAALIPALNHNPKILDGKKTVPMVHSLEQGWLNNYNPQKGTLLHQGIEFKILKGSDDRISEHPIISIGANPFNRELISLDPGKSPLLEEKFRELMNHLEKIENRADKNLLEAFSAFIAHQVFDRKYSALNAVELFLEKWINAHENDPSSFANSKFGYQLPVIPLEDFTNEKVGVCRHVSLTAAYFLDKLVKRSNGRPILPSGKIYYVRDELSQGGHAWVLFIPDHFAHIWHIDVFWGVVKDLTHPNDRKELAAAYGTDAIRREIERFVLPQFNR